MLVWNEQNADKSIFAVANAAYQRSKAIGAKYESE